MEPLAVSVREASRLTGLSRDELYAQVYSGKLAASKVGRGRMVIHVPALRELIDANTIKTQTHMAMQQRHKEGAWG